MTNYEKYVNLFAETFSVTAQEAETLEYQGISEWDSVGHMGLISAIEDTFDIMMDTDDIIDLSSFAKGKEILAQNYNIEF